MDKIAIVILAAGFGTRMKSQKSKVCFKICGGELITHILRKSYEITSDVSVVLNYNFEEVKSVVLRDFPQTKIHKQDHDNFPGTGGSLRGMKFDAQKIVVLCGDMPLIKVDEIKKLCESDADVTLSMFEAKNPFGYGRVIIKNDEVQKIVEEKDANENEKRVNLANAGCYAFKREILDEILPRLSNQNAQNEYYLTDVIKIAKDERKIVRAVMVDEQNFMGINDKFALSVAENLMQDEIKQNLMKQGVIMRLPQTIYIDYRAKFEGECELENGVSIIGDCTIKNSIIKANSIIEDSLIENSDLGPCAHVRPGCEISNTHIGNFVELKKAKVNGIKAGHLSYLGDCEIDEGTNVGCGTITCNYDGKNKYKTIIGKNVFIGSDIQLIAPVKIEDNVLIAAGSTITNDVQSGALAISRTKQVNKDGFFDKFFKDKLC